jgi:hypothetical protein
VINFITKIRGEFGKLCNGYYGEIGEGVGIHEGNDVIGGPCCSDEGFDEWLEVAGDLKCGGGNC